MWSLLRGGVLAVFGGTFIHLLRRGKAVEEKDCVDPEGHIGCRACIELNRCRLPRGLSVKQYLSKDENREEQKT
jgi:hypothetical protein